MSRLLYRIGGLGKKLFTTPAGLLTLGGTGTAGILAQTYIVPPEGKKNFFHHSFVTRKPHEPVVDFYSTEEFLQILGIFPFAIHFILAGVEWDSTRDNAMNVYNSMEISFDITEKEITTASGEKVVAFFNKRERFINYIPFTRILLWDQVQNYGYRRKSDGSLEVQHHGESFYGPWPVLYLVKLHAAYVIWATERHINSELFGSEDLEAVEHQRSNIPLVAFNEFMTKLKGQQEEVIKDLKSKKMDTTKAEANLRRLKSIKTGDVSIATTQQKRLKRTVSKISVEDPEAQAAIKQALGAVAKMEGGEAAQKALRNMLEAAQAEGTQPVQVKSRVNLA